jgi:hypothetical protein
MRQVFISICLFFVYFNKQKILFKKKAYSFSFNTIKIRKQQSPEHPAQKIHKIVIIMNFIMIIIDYAAELFSNNFRNVIHNLIMCPKIFDENMNFITNKKYFITFGL